MLSHGDLLPCSPEIDETELALDSLDALVADEIAETMSNRDEKLSEGEMVMSRMRMEAHEAES